MVPSIPNFRVIRRIGEGGFGSVWLAETVTGKLRAVKWVRRACFEQPGLSPAGVDALFQMEFEGVERFEDLAAKTPELVSIQVVGKIADAAYYYVMPLADNARPDTDDNPETYLPLTLHRWLEIHGPMPWNTAIELIASVARGAAALHRAGLQHGDISSDNILFIDGRPVLADPGLTSLEGDRVAGHSPGFSDPAARCGGGSGGCCDVFALGRMLYHAVSGRHPAESFPLVPAQQMAALPAQPFAEFLDLCCDPDPANRFANPDALLAWLQQQFPEAIPPRPAPTIRPWLAKALAAMLAVTVGAGIWTYSAWPKTQAPPRYGGLPTRGFTSGPDLLPERAVWRYAMVADPDQPVPADAWREGRGPFHFGPDVSELPERLSFIPGKFGQALHFDQRHAGLHTVEGFVELPYVTGEFTIALWVRVDGDPPATHPGCVWSLGILPEPQLMLAVDNHLRVYPAYSGQEVKSVTLQPAAVDMSDGQWRHLAVTVSRKRLSFYVDGKPAGEAPFAADPGFIDAPQFLGYSQWVVSRATRFWGAADEVCWLPRVLRAAEIADLAHGHHIDTAGGFLLPMDGELAGSRQAPAPGVYGRSGGGDDGTRIRTQPPSPWLILETTLDLALPANHPFIDLNCTGIPNIEIDGQPIDPSNPANTNSPSAKPETFRRINLEPLKAGIHTLRVRLHSPQSTTPARLGLRLHDYGEPVK